MSEVKQWLMTIGIGGIERLADEFESRGFSTLKSLQYLQDGDLSYIFSSPKRLLFAEKRALEQELRQLKCSLKSQESGSRSVESRDSNRETIAVATSRTNSSTDAAQSAATKLTATKNTIEKKSRKKLTYKSEKPISPLQSYILHQEKLIEEQGCKVRSLEKEMDELTREITQTGKNCALPALPCCSKCHLREGHNRLNCPYPNPCSAAKYCGNLEKHPDEKQVVKDQNKHLSDERKKLKSMKEELQNRQRSSANVAQRYAVRVKEILIESDPDRYTREVGGKIIEDWRLINKDSSILEKHFKSKIPSPEEARTLIQTIPSTQHKTVAGKTSVHNPYKKLWEARGISWPTNKMATTTRRGMHQVTTRSEYDGAAASLDEDTIHSPQRKKVVIDHELEEDYQLALGLQESLKTLPKTFDLEDFEQTVDEKMPRPCEEPIPSNVTTEGTSLDVLAEAALRIGEFE